MNQWVAFDNIPPVSTKYVLLVNGVQHLASIGDTIEIDGKAVSDAKVLALWDDEKATIGEPYLDKFTPKLEIVESHLGDKVMVRRFKSKSRYKKTKGHRQDKSTLKVIAVA